MCFYFFQLFIVNYSFRLMKIQVENISWLISTPFCSETHPSIFCYVISLYAGFTERYIGYKFGLVVCDEIASYSSIQIGPK